MSLRGKKFVLAFGSQGDLTLDGTASPNRESCA
jgi:hypothetical protein